MSLKHSEREARQAAKNAGLLIKKGRSRPGVLNPDNLGLFMLVDPKANVVVQGSRYDLTSDEVVAYCSWYQENWK